MAVDVWIICAIMHYKWGKIIMTQIAIFTLVLASATTGLAFAAAIGIAGIAVIFEGISNA